jgi:ubiquinone/menaquinone biosynthesis C-methylase UbiE
VSRWYESTRHLYDHVDEWAAKHGPDANDRLRPRRDGESGEERFTQLVQQHVRPGDTLVDIGTGDAGWLMKQIAPHAHRAVGFDHAARRLWHGAQRRTALGAKNVELLLADGRQVPMKSGSADVITNRRGPLTYNDEFMREGLRILAPGGLAFEISIGEQNARELDEVFDERSQMHGAYASGELRLDTLAAFYRRYGLKVFIAESYLCRETFASREALLFRLETTPAIDGFDPDGDAPVIDRFMAEHGLSLTVHRLVFAARKAR